MSLELLAGQRQKNESSRAVQACNDYLRMGSGRSLVALRARYGESQENSAPTRSRGTLEHWSSRYSWQERAESCDAELEKRKTEHAQAVMQSGLALDYERVGELKSLAIFLKAQIFEQGKDGAYHNVWLPDVKQIGSGDSVERVDIERFNSAIIDQYRGTLDDLAKETGGRKVKTETEHSGGFVVNFISNVDDSKI